MINTSQQQRRVAANRLRAIIIKREFATVELHLTIQCCDTIQSYDMASSTAKCRVASSEL
jgi:hypothetical protein